MRNSTDWPVGYGRRVLKTVDSTNAEAARLARQLRGPEWILALHQTNARGRRGRVWSNPKGNFAATLVLQPSESPETSALRSFVAALALFDAIVAVTGRAEGLALKWPNDVLLNGGKVAGILLESSGTGSSLNHLSIGIGVNLLHAPDPVKLEAGALRPVSLVSETGANVTPESFLDALAPAYAAYETQFQSLGFAPIRTAWLDRATRLGEVITARTGREEITGTFQTVDELGQLVLSTPRSVRAIPAADVYF